MSNLPATSQAEARVPREGATPLDDPEHAEVLHGLRADPPTVSARWFYDALGSALFDAITRLKEYYPTRCELEILEAHGAALGAELPQNLAVVELGSGNADKIGRLLPYLQAPRTYHPVDVSHAALRATEVALRGRFADLHIESLPADFSAPESMRALFDAATAHGPMLLFFPGSTLGNLDPERARGFLSRLAAAVPVGTPLLLGVDLVKDRSVLEAAYDDPIGLTAAFNRNVLAHLNTRFGSDFDPRRWRHAARWAADHHRVEMWLHSEGRQTVRFGSAQLRFEDGAGIHTESSHKWTRSTLERLAGNAGWRLETWLTDGRDWFAEALLTSQLELEPTRSTAKDD